MYLTFDARFTSKRWCPSHTGYIKVQPYTILRRPQVLSRWAILVQRPLPRFGPEGWLWLDSAGLGCRWAVFLYKESRKDLQV